MANGSARRVDRYLCRSAVPPGPSRTRTARAKRCLELRAVQAPYDRAFWLVPGGEEAVWLYDEADRAFVDGLFLASLLSGGRQSRGEWPLSCDDTRPR